MDKRIEAELCRTMKEVRKSVDSLDEALIALLAERFAYMRAAARIKQGRDEVRDEERKRAVIDAAVQHAKAGGVPSDFVARMWEDLVETSIAYEGEEWERQRG